MNEQGESFIYGYVPIVVAKCGVFLKEKGIYPTKLEIADDSCTDLIQLRMLRESSVLADLQNESKSYRPSLIRQIGMGKDLIGQAIQSTMQPTFYGAT